MQQQRSQPLVDYHVHTARCGHAVGSMEQYVEAAIEAGLGEIGFSDHLYLYWLADEARDPELAMADWELDAYVSDVERCRERYREDIRIRLATEADFVPGHERSLEAILGRYDWDYVVGSVHFVNGWGFDDSRYLDGYARWHVDRLYERYFDLVGASAETGLFDVIGHVDLIKKFGHRSNQPLQAQYARLAERFARAKVCVEVNTAGLRKPCGEMYPHPELLEAICRAGVPTTFASDAHDPKDVARDFSLAAKSMRSVGYREYLHFDRRKATAIDLTEPMEAATERGHAP